MKNDWIAGVHELWREWQKWARLSRVLSRKGAEDWTSGRIYVAVVQVIMLYK